MLRQAQVRLGWKLQVDLPVQRHFSIWTLSRPLQLQVLHAEVVGPGEGEPTWSLFGADEECARYHREGEEGFPG